MCILRGRPLRVVVPGARDAEPGRPPRALWIRHTRHRRRAPTRLAARSGARSSTPPPGRRRRSSSRCRAPGRRAARGPGASAARRARAGGWPSGTSQLARRRRPAAPPRPARAVPAPLPRTKLEAPVPDGDRSPAGSWPTARASTSPAGAATVGHNWGAEHAERWVWLHAGGFEDAPEAWLELAIAARPRRRRCSRRGSPTARLARRPRATGSAGRVRATFGRRPAGCAPRPSAGRASTARLRPPGPDRGLQYARPGRRRAPRAQLLDRGGPLRVTPGPPASSCDRASGGRTSWACGSPTTGFSVEPFPDP